MTKNDKVEWFMGDVTTDQQVENERIVEFLLASKIKDESKRVSDELRNICNIFTIGFNSTVRLSYNVTFHWSRVWEYSWIILNAGFTPGEVVLDAGGGGSFLCYRIASLGSKVVNLDLEMRAFDKYADLDIHKFYGDLVTTQQGDVLDIPYEDNYFDKTVCCSVLEHTSNPIKAVQELQRVTKPGGKMLLTFDVANYERKNHSISFDIMYKILDFLNIPSNLVKGKKICMNQFDELDDNGNAIEGERVNIGVLGICKEKA